MITFWFSGIFWAKNVNQCCFFSFSDIFDAMSLVKHSTGETVIQQGKSENALICQDDIFVAGSSKFTPSP